MSNRGELISQLEAARYELHKAQTLVAELEFQLAESPNEAAAQTVTYQHDTSLFGNELTDQPSSLLEIEQQLRLFIEYVPAAIAMFDTEMNYLIVSQRWLSDFHLNKSDVIGHSHYEVFPDIPESWKAIHQRCLQGAIEKSEDDPFPHADGTLDWVRWEVRPWHKANGEIGGIFLFSEVITRQKREQIALERYAKRMEVLHEIDQALITGGSVQTLVDTALNRIRELIPCPRANVIIIDPETNAGTLFSVDVEGHTILTKGFPIPVMPDILEGLDEKYVKIVADLRLLPETLPRRQVISEGFTAALQATLMFEGYPLGWLGLFSDAPEFFTEEYQAIAAEIASQLAIAIHQMRLSEELTLHQQTLKSLVEQRTTELVTAKEQVEAILNNSPDAILLVDTDLSIQQTNAAFNNLFRCQPDDYFEQSALMLIHSEYMDMVIRMAEAVISEQTGLYFEVKALRKDGTDFEAEFSAGLIRSNGLVWSIRDITERKATERQLRYQASLQDNVSDAVIVTDLTFRIQSWNKAAERIYGWTMEEAIGKVAPEFLNIRFLSSYDEEMSLKRFNEHGSLQQETIQSHKDGRDISILGSATRLEDNNGIAYGVIAINHDITENKAIERQLRYQASLQDNVSDAVIVTDVAFRIQSWNKAAERIYGWRTDEVINKSVADILRTEFEITAERERSILQLREQGWWQGEVTQHHRDGHTIHILGSITLIKDNEGNPLNIVAVNHDISERKLVERALATSAAEIHDLYNSAPCGYHSLNKDGVIVQINDTELRWLGYSRDEVVGRLRITDIFTAASVEVFQKEFPAFMERGWINDLEFDVVRKDGSIMHILLNATAVYDDDGQYLKSRSTLFDITELQHAQQVIYESETRYRLLAENISDVIAKVSPDGIRTYITPSCFALLGYTPDELIGKPSIELVHPDDGPASRAIVVDAINTSNSEALVTQRVQHKAGHYLWVEVKVSILRDPTTGSLLEVMMVMRDITERKRTQAALNTKFREELEFQNYLKALHEITIELTQIDHLDIFYKRTVELGLERMGFGRLAMFLYDAESGMALGTYGTDTQGNLIDEHHIQFVPNPQGILLRAFERSERFYIDEHVSLQNNMQAVGFGWNAATVLWDGTQSLGWLVVDNLLTQAPASKPLLDILGLYALTVGTLLAQKQTQIALRESETKYRLLAENITDVIAKMSPDGIRTFITPSCYSLLGYTPEELIGRPGFEIVHPDDRQRSQSVLMKAINSSSSSFTLIQRVLHKNGHYIWVEVTTTLVCDASTRAVQEIMGVIRDVTERKHAEDALRESEERFRMLVEAAPVAIVITNQSGQITLVNDQAQRIFGYQRDEMLGQAVEILLPENIHKRHVHHRAAYLDAPAIRPMGSGLELQARRKDNTQFPVEIELSYIKTPNDILVMSFVVDITQRKQAELALKQALKQEKELGELKTRFVSMASHEFRTPLATILALTETLSAYRHKLSNEQIDQRLDKIQIQVGHLKDIMEDVLLLARMQARRVEFNPTDVDLDALCRSVLDEFESSIDTQNHLVYSCAANIPTLKLDRKLMRQIISNLVGNAIKYSPEHKPVHVTLEYANDALILNVKDEGIGIPQTDLGHLFQPFHRADNVGTIPGTGLGLVIAKEAVELHGGNITVESQQNIGTTFTIYIPLTTEGGNNHD